MDQAFLDRLKQEQKMYAEMIERMKPSIHMEKMLEDIRNVSRLHETIAGINLPAQHLLELHRHLETRQELANAIDKRSLDISKIVETSRLTDEIARQMKHNLILPDAVTVHVEQLQAQQRLIDSFRMPRIHEAAEQFAAVKEAALASSAALEATQIAASKALALFLPSQEKFAQLTASLETPWVSTTQALSSFESVARLASIGNAIHIKPFDASSSDALRTLFGDWSRITFPQEIYSDWRARQNFYHAHGLDRVLTYLPEPAFTDSLYKTGILRHDLFPLGAPLPEPKTAEEQADPEKLGKQRALDAYDILFNFETKLREFIHAVMTERYGERWEKQRVPGEMRKQWEEKRQSGMAKGETEQRLLWYADFTNYVDIILRGDNWREVFKDIFLNDLDIRVSFQRLQPLRLPVMHARVITKNDFLLLTVEAQRILRAIGILDDSASC